MVEIIFTIYLGTGILMDRTIESIVSKKVFIEAASFTTCKNLIVQETDLTKKELDDKALVVLCNFKNDRKNQTR